MSQGMFWRSAVLSLCGLALFAMAALLPQACSTRRASPDLTATMAATAMAQTTTGPCTDSTVAPSTVGPEVDCAAPPNTFAFQPFVTSNQGILGPTVDAWAWATFAALNWPALTTTDTASYPTSYVRGIPDTGRTFAAATNTDVAVWETFKEKREVFNNVVTAGQWQQSTYPPSQTPDAITGGLVPPCATGEKNEAAALVKKQGLRMLAGTTKVSPALVNTGDETAEVASPAQESQNDLCLPYQGTPQYATCQSNFPVPPGKDATAIYPPNIQNPRSPVGPRVYDPSLDPLHPEKSLVYFEVRVNYDYFKYVVSNSLNLLNPPSGPQPVVALQPPYQLPWRTSASPGPGSGGAGSKFGYDANGVMQQYKAVPAPSTPPPVGSIQVKAAWKLLPNGPDPAYHSTQALHFQTIAASPYVCYQVDHFGLIGLHIIQRVHTGSTQSGNENWGGTFIFATWEHNSVRDAGGYKYVNLLAMGGAEQNNPVPYPPPANALPVTTLGPDPSPLPTTAGVTRAFYGQITKADSVWKNYRLIGTQFIPMGHTDSLTYNQPYYLANLVVETNRGLQNFQGLPRGITANSNYNNFPAANATAYDPNQPNVAFKNMQGASPVNMGGCMGCHGVAEVLGSAFSFVLLDGQSGAGIDTPTHVAIPPNPPPTP